MKNKKSLIIILVIIIIALLGAAGLLGYKNFVGNDAKSQEDKQTSETKENKEESEKIENSDLQMGDFINYKVNYTNVGDYHSGQTVNDQVKGWRILSINDDNTITLISAGVPIKYCQNCDEERINNDLSNLYKVLNTDSTVVDSSYSYFLDSGFDGNTFDMTQVFNTGLEDTSSIHAMTGEELINTYEKITGKETTIEELFYSSATLSNRVLKLDENSRVADLLENGYAYYINAVTNKDRRGNRVLHSQSWGYLTGLEYGEDPIRIVLNLKPDVKIVSGKGTIDEPYEMQ